VEKAIAFGGRIADAANDHHEEVFRGHYAQGSTLRVMSGRVITTAQDHWFNMALEGPTMLTRSTDVLNAPALRVRHYHRSKTVVSQHIIAVPDTI
jgi:hypothetical protein